MYTYIQIKNNLTWFCLQLIQKPVLIKGSKLVSRVLNWDLDYLKQHISSVCCNVMVSKSHEFKYYNQKKIGSNTMFKPISRPNPMTFSKFVDEITNWKKGDSR